MYVTKQVFTEKHVTFNVYNRKEKYKINNLSSSPQKPRKKKAKYIHIKKMKEIEQQKSMNKLKTGKQLKVSVKQKHRSLKRSIKLTNL